MNAIYTGMEMCVSGGGNMTRIYGDNDNLCGGELAFPNAFISHGTAEANNSGGSGVKITRLSRCEG